MKCFALNDWSCITPEVLETLCQWRGQTLKEVWLNWDEKEHKNGHQLHWSSCCIVIGRKYWAFASGSCTFCFIQSDLTQPQLSAELEPETSTWQLNPLPGLKQRTDQTIEDVRLVEYRDDFWETRWHGIELITETGSIVFCLDDGDFNGLEFETPDPNEFDVHCVHALQSKSKTVIIK